VSGKRKTLLAAATATLTCGLMAPAAMAAAFTPARPVPPEAATLLTPVSVVGEIVTESSAAVLAFWTAAEMAAADANAAPVPASAPVAVPPQPPGTPTSAPGTAPSAPGGGPAPSAKSSEHSRVWTTHGVEPATTMGRLYFRLHNGRPSVCTATVVSAPNDSVLWTAGHCVANGNGGWYTDFMFVPGTHDGLAPWGRWTAREKFTSAYWFFDASPAYDFAALTMNRGGRHDTQVQKVTGSQGYRFGYGQNNSVYNFGYPANVYAPYRNVDASQLRYCTGNTWSATVSGYSMLAMNCDMGSGASGGPWLYDLKISRGWGYLVSDNSFRYASRSDIPVFGPYLGSTALVVYEKAKAVRV
jgi:hypothetical protein